ncbi:glycerate kinase, partial [Pseudomonas aeruginosa]|uniref:glycerate kinase n=1 Tax=Pseudomonas aeruginosa TaxID=287 RepID=UPI0020C89B3E
EGALGRRLSPERARPAAGRGPGAGQRLHDAGIDAAFSLAPGPISLEQACAGAAAELEARAEQIARLWRLAQASREG